MDGRVCTAIRDLLVDRVKKSNVKIDAIVGLDARGFLFGFTISAELGTYVFKLIEHNHFNYVSIINYSIYLNYRYSIRTDSKEG